MCLFICCMTSRKVTVVILAVLQWFRVNPQQVPVEKIVAPPGSNVTLSCSFPVKPNMVFDSLVINWQRGDKVVHRFYYPSGQLDKQNEVYKGRTSLFNDQLQTGNASLMLNDIQPEHDGDYKCTVTCNNGPYGQKVQLLVAAPYDEPEIAVQYLCKNTTVSLSSSHGFPEPDVTWFAPIGDEVKTLTLDTRGRYRLQSNITLNLTSTVTVRVEMSLDVLSQKFSRALTLHPQPERCEDETSHCRIGLFISGSVVLIILALIIPCSVFHRN